MLSPQFKRLLSPHLGVWRKLRVGVCRMRAAGEGRREVRAEPKQIGKGGKGRAAALSEPVPNSMQ